MFTAPVPDTGRRQTSQLSRMKTLLPSFDQPTSAPPMAGFTWLWSSSVFQNFAGTPVVMLLVLPALKSYTFQSPVSK